MNRRHFIQSLSAAFAGFTILPAATTYDRIWRVAAKVKPVRIVPNPEWVSAPYECRFIMDGKTIKHFMASMMSSEGCSVPVPMGNMKFVPDKYPLRFKMVGDQYVPITPFKEI